MMDLTPLDIRKKKGDFTRGLRGYHQQQVDQFLDLVAERLEELVKLNLALRDKAERLDERVQSQEGRERAVQEALVSAQSLKQGIHDQAKREAELILWEVRVAADLATEEIRNAATAQAQDLVELSRARALFLKGFRSLLERGMDVLDIAEVNPPPEELDLDIVQLGRSVAGDAGELEGAPSGR